ncbi:MAG TPA: hypothetical protein PLD86_12725 [Vicinamibacteria bacterium]|nr:hypothetical protein [Vicinamibacteria bacterium]
MVRNHFAGAALGALAVAVAAAMTLGGSTRHVALNLGPGDTPFVAGFEANSDVEDKVGWHWTTYDARVEFPFTTAGSEVSATLRYARVFGEEAVVNVSVGGAATEGFRARGGEIRTTTLAAPRVEGPLVVSIRSDSHERRNMGLRMDTLSLQATGGAPFKLRGRAALRPPLTVMLLFAGLVILGVSPLSAGGASLLAALAFAGRANSDLFGAWRQTHLAPEMLVVATLVLLAGRQWLHRRVPMERALAATLASAALVTMLWRLALLSHPDFYYPDLLTHTRVVEAIRAEGPSFFLHPADALSAQKAWTKPVMGSLSALPYAVMFHTPFAVLAALLGLTTDEIETALKAGSSLVSVIPILLGGALAARLSLPPLAALLLCVIPTYASRLSFALLPALFGHMLDLVVLLTIVTVMGRDGVGSARSVLPPMAALLLGHLAYTSGVVNEAVFMGVLVVLLLLSGRPGLGLGLGLTLAEAGAALGAFLLYYRHFVGDVYALGGRILGMGAGGAGPSASVYPVESFWALLFERTNTFFGWPYLSLAILGLWLGGPAIRESKAARAWAIAYLILILLRARIPDVFRYGHETLFLTPLIALLAGTALVMAWRRGGAWRNGAVAAGLVLLAASMWQQWLAISDQLGNAL